MAQEIDPETLVEISQKHDELMLLKDPLEFFDSLSYLQFKYKDDLKILQSMNSTSIKQTLSHFEITKRVLERGTEGGEEGRGSLWLTYDKQHFPEVLTVSEEFSLPQIFEVDDENEDFASTYNEWLKREFLFNGLEKNPEYGPIIMESFRKENELRIQADSLQHGDARKRLEKLERKIMSGCCSNFELFDVEIDDNTVIHTAFIHASAATKGKHSSIPLVMLHGLGNAIPAFHRLFKSLSHGGKVYAIDLPGFGLSTRVTFPDDPVGCENKVVDLIDKWRIKMKIDKMILLGHSLGGYYAGAYFLQYHKYVHHLIMLEPWGMYSEEDDEGKSMLGDLKRKIAVTLINLSHIDPALALLYSGPIVAHLLLYTFMDKKIRDLYGKDYLRYIAACSTTELLTGVNAFIEISNKTFKYAVNPLTKRLLELLESVKIPITFIHGRQSNICKGGISLTGILGRPSVIIHCIDKAGHHVQIEKPAEVVKYILTYIFSNEIHPF